MDFGFTDEQAHFREVMARFALKELAPHYKADDKSESFRRESLAAMCGMGLVGIRAPEQYGGQGADCVTTGIASEEVSRQDMNAGYLILISSLIIEIMKNAATERQMAEWIPPIASGEKMTALFLTEPDHGSDAASLAMKAEKDGDGWRLTGEKTSISFGMAADTGVVFARTSDNGARGVSAFFIDLDDAHLQRSAFSDLGGRSVGRASVAFDGHPVPAGALIGSLGEGFVRCMQGFDYSRALISLMCIGAAQQSIDDAVEYVKERTAFDQPIGKFQGVAFPLVEYQTQLEGARLLSYKALWLKDQGKPHALEANMAKWWGPKLGAEAAHQALLLFGHTGYSDEVPHGQRMRDIIGLEIGDGTAQIAKLVAARHLLGRHAAP